MTLRSEDAAPPFTHFADMNFGLIYRKRMSAVERWARCHSERRRNRLETMQTRDDVTAMLCQALTSGEQWSLCDAECRYLMTTRRIKFEAPTELAHLPAAYGALWVHATEPVFIGPPLARFCPPCVRSPPTRHLRDNIVRLSYEPTRYTYVLTPLFAVARSLNCEKCRVLC